MLSRLSQTPSTGLRHPSFNECPFSGGRCRKAMVGVWVWLKLQALVYGILPSTTAVFSYAIGPRKLSANEQFFVGVQTVVSLLQTTQIISDVCFILPCCLRHLKLKPKSFESRLNSLFFFFYPGSMRLMFTWVPGR